MSATRVVKLNFPIEHDGKTIDEVTLRRPTVGDMITAEKVGTGGEIAFNAAVCAAASDIPFPVFRKIDAADSDAIAKAMQDLVGNSRARAGEGSPS